MRVVSRLPSCTKRCDLYTLSARSWIPLFECSHSRQWKLPLARYPAHPQDVSGNRGSTFQSARQHGKLPELIDADKRSTHARDTQLSAAEDGRPLMLPARDVIISWHSSWPVAGVPMPVVGMRSENSRPQLSTRSCLQSLSNGFVTNVSSGAPNTSISTEYCSPPRQSRAQQVR